MSPHSRRVLAVLILLLLGLVALFLVRCNGQTPAPAEVRPTPTPAPTPAEPTTAQPAAAPAVTQAPAPTPATPAKEPDEDLAAAAVKAPAEVVAGAAFQVEWTGPNNRDDYVTIVPVGARDTHYASYAETHRGRSLALTAPTEAGDCEVRYVAARSKKVLGRAPITVTAATATLSAPEEAPLGSTISVAWTGPNNEADYITVVPQGTPDGRYDNYSETRKGSPLKLELLPEAGDAELRYMTGKGAKVLARRAIKIVKPETSVTGPDEVVAGKVFEATWVGPNNPGDYITIVPKNLPEGRYDNYTETRKGSPLPLTALIQPGDAELRYMTGQGSKVLARHPIRIIAATVALEAPAETVVGAAVPITWTGPDNRGDYITIVRQGTPDGQYARYADTSRGSPANVEAPMDIGPAEIRYVSGQGAKVLARRAITVSAAQVTLRAPTKTAVGSTVAVEWTGPNNRGDYLTIVAKAARDGAAGQTAPTTRGSPANVRAPAQAGAAEIRYMSGQGDRVLGRVDIELTGEAVASGP
jgi:Ca-activated chloride channel family protein